MESDSIGAIILDGDESYTDCQYSFSVIIPCCTRSLVCNYKVYNHRNVYAFRGAIEVKYYRLLGRDVKRSFIHCVDCVSDQKVKKMFPDIFSICNFTPVCPELDYERVLF